MLCNKCGSEGTPNLEETGPHTKATCKECGAYIKMMGKNELDNLITQLSQVNENVMDTLTIKTNVPVEFMDRVFKQIGVSLIEGYKEGEGEIVRFLDRTNPYKYSFTYKGEG